MNPLGVCDNQFQILVRKLPSPWIYLFLTRGTRDFKYCFEFTSNDIYKVSYFSGTIREWNRLPSEIVSTESLDGFKSKLGNNLQD